MSKRKEKKRVSKERFDEGMKFWRKVNQWKIGSDYYDVIIQDKIGGGKLCGEMDYDNREIRIDKGLVGMQSLQPVSTLFHEVFHGVVGTFTDCDHGEDDERVEYFIDLAAESLVMLMLDNPENFQVILDRIRDRRDRHLKEKK